MRVFVIADASKRRAKPTGLLFWEPDESGGQGRFSLEVSSVPDAGSLPLSLSFCATRRCRRATPEESEAWVRSRIVPEDRHNIAAVLRANGLTEYDEVSLLASCKGRSSDDDLLVFEIDVPDSLAVELAADSTSDSHAGSEAPTAPAQSRADRVLAALERRRSGGEVTYAFVGLPSPDDAPEATSKSNSAKQIGTLIRRQRRTLGLTQTQLADRAGISQTVLSRVESGAGNPTLNLLDDIAAALDMHLNIELKSDAASQLLMDPR